MPVHHVSRRPAMNTLFEFILVGEDGEHLTAVGEAAMEEVVRIEHLLSRFDPASEVSRLNRLAHGQPQLVSIELVSLLQLCLKHSQITAGHFDLTATSQAQSGKNLSFSTIEFDPVSRVIRFPEPNLFLDFGAVGKGYALDRAGLVLREFGITQALLHAGTSSVLAIGGPTPQDGWPIGLRNPFPPPAEIAQIRLRDCSLSSSAVLGEDSAKPSDIISPITRQPLSEQQACVVLANTATQTEILSTAFLSMGKAGAANYLPDLGPDTKAAWISTTGLEWLNNLPPT